MSPFTSDSKVLTELLKSEHNVWKTLSGPIESLQIVKRSSDRKDDRAINNETLEVQIKTSQVAASNSPACIATLKVSVEWELMAMKKMVVELVEKKCLK